MKGEGAAKAASPKPDVWTLVRTRTHDRRPDYTVKRNGKEVGRIYEQYGGMGNSAHFAWFLNRFHGLSENLQGAEPTLEKAGRALKAAWADLVMRRGIAIVERALR